jgi:hypothetical protein
MRPMRSPFLIVDPSGQTSSFSATFTLAGTGGWSRRTSRNLNKPSH